jgi:hypothetical protein
MSDTPAIAAFDASASTFGLGASAAATGPVPRRPAFYEFNGARAERPTTTGARSWYVRGQNFCVGYSELDAGEKITEDGLPDEHMILVPDPGQLAVAMESGQSALVAGPAVVVVPPGTATVEAAAAGRLLRVFTARAGAVTRRAYNQSRYAGADPLVDPLAEVPAVAGPGTLRVYRLADIPLEPDRLGRIFQTDSLTVNWFPPHDGPRDGDTLSPHVHQGFEQATVTLGGRHVHHIRLPWSTRLRDWRNDQHAECGSPSVAIIPPGNIHTTQAVGAGLHHLVDVFAPHRRDFLRSGWVLNAADYEAQGADQ